MGYYVDRIKNALIDAIIFYQDSDNYTREELEQKTLAELDEIFDNLKF